MKVYGSMVFGWFKSRNAHFHIFKKLIMNFQTNILQAFFSVCKQSISDILLK